MGFNNVSFDVILNPNQGLDKYAYVRIPKLTFTLDQTVAANALDTPVKWFSFFNNFIKANPCGTDSTGLEK